MPAWYFLTVLLHLTLAISESYADDHKESGLTSFTNDEVAKKFAPKAKVAKSAAEVKDQSIALSKVNDHVKFVVSYSKEKQKEPLPVEIREEGSETPPKKAKADEALSLVNSHYKPTQRSKTHESNTESSRKSEYDSLHVTPSAIDEGTKRILRIHDKAVDDRKEFEMRAIPLDNISDIPITGLLMPLEIVDRSKFGRNDEPPQKRGAVPSHWRLKGEKNAKKNEVSAKDCICQGRAKWCYVEDSNFVSVI